MPILAIALWCKLSKLTVIAINGIALAGKDTFATRVMEQNGINDICISTIDPIKKIYSEFFGWDGTKTPEHRANLHTLKMIWKQCSNGPLNWTRKEILRADANDKNVVFLMVREFEEMVDIVSAAKFMGFKAFSLEVQRDGLEIPPVEQMFLDSIPSSYKYDFTIFNETVDTFPITPELDKLAAIFACGLCLE